MPEGPIDEFLNQVTAERQPLTGLEKKEAMLVAWKVRDTAKGKISEGKMGVILTDEKQTERYIIHDIFPTSEIPSWAPKDSNLRMDVLRNVKSALGRMVPVGFDSYYISSSGVIKQTVIYPPTQLEGVEEETFLKKSLEPSQRGPALRKQAILSKEQSTQEIYHPDKTDLNALLQNLSSAESL